MNVINYVIDVDKKEKTYPIEHLQHLKPHINPLGKHGNNCLKVILNSVDRRVNIAEEKSLSNCLNKIINTFLANTINEKYWLVIAAGILRPISKNIFNHPCT